MNDLGRQGEELAIQHLQQLGFKIRFRNWQYGHKEVDIIAEKEGIIHFVEVKARNYNYWIEPKLAVQLKKQNNLIIAADGYMQRYGETREALFDIVSVIFFKDHHEVELIENAFEPRF